MSDQINEPQIAQAIAHAKSWLKRLEADRTLDEASGFTAEDLFVLAYTISTQSPIVFELEKEDPTPRSAVFASASAD